MLMKKRSAGGGLSTIAIIMAAMSLSGCLSSGSDGPTITPTSDTATQTNSGSTQTGSGSTQTGGSSTQTGGSSTQTGGSSTQTGGGSTQTGGGSAQTGGGSTQTGGTLQDVDLVGWGFRTTVNNGKMSASLATGTGSLRVRPNPDGTTSPASVTIDGTKFTKSCDYKDESYDCTDADDPRQVKNVAGIEKLDEDDGYKYLYVMRWNNIAEDRPVAVYIGGKQADRTPPSNVPLSATYSGFAKFGVETGNSHEGAVNLNIRNGVVTGTMSDFRIKQTVNGQTVRTNVGGRVEINGSVSGNTLNAGINGNFGSHTIQTGRMNGGFFGPNGEEVGGGIAGTTTNGDAFGGGWVAKKQ